MKWLSLLSNHSKQQRMSIVKSILIICINSEEFPFANKIFTNLQATWIGRLPFRSRWSVLAPRLRSRINDSEWPNLAQWNKGVWPSSFSRWRSDPEELGLSLNWQLSYSFFVFFRRDEWLDLEELESFLNRQFNHSFFLLFFRRLQFSWKFTIVQTLFWIINLLEKTHVACCLFKLNQWND